MSIEIVHQKASGPLLWWLNEAIDSGGEHKAWKREALKEARGYSSAILATIRQDIRQPDLFQPSISEHYAAIDRAIQEAVEPETKYLINLRMNIETFLRELGVNEAA